MKQQLLEQNGGGGNEKDIGSRRKRKRHWIKLARVSLRLDTMEKYIKRII